MASSPRPQASPGDEEPQRMEEEPHGMEEAPWRVHLKEISSRLESKAELSQFEAVRSELSALQERIRGLEAELSHARLQPSPEQTGAGEPQNSEVVKADVENPSEHALPEEALDDEDPREYALAESVWDSLLVCGLATYPAESFMVALGWLANIAIQVYFCVIVGNQLSQPVLDPKKVRDLAIWRVVLGHDVRQTDELTGMSLVERTCSNEFYADTSGAQQSLYVQLTQYSQSVSLICIFFWLSMMLREMARTFDFTRGICSLPRVAMDSRLGQAPDGTIAVEAISKRRLSLLLVTVTIPRFGIAIALGYLGVTYLVYLKSTVDLLLNAIALQFVLDTDEFLYPEVVPRRVRRIIASVKPLAISGLVRPPRRFRRIPVRALTLATLALLLLTVVWGKMLVTEFDLVAKSKEILCGGDRRFVFARDRSLDGVLTAEMHPFDEDDLLQSHMFRSIFGRAKLDPATTLEELAPVNEALHVPARSVEEVRDASASTFQEAADLLPCYDLVPGKPANQEAFLAKAFQKNGTVIRSCSEVKGPPCELELRPFCPSTCGCASAYGGLYDRQGCSIQCDAEVAFWEVNVELARLANVCQDGYNLDLARYVSYFEEVQKELLDGWRLVEHAGFIWVGEEGFMRILSSSYLEAWPLVTNMTLGKWAKANARRMQDQGAPDVCGLVTFVYKAFNLDLCDTSSSSIFAGRVGSIRGMCWKTCGDCDDSEGAPPYKNTSWGSLVEWMHEALDEPVLGNTSDISGCSYYAAQLSTSEWRVEHEGWLDYWCQRAYDFLAR